LKEQAYELKYEGEKKVEEVVENQEVNEPLPLEGSGESHHFVTVFFPL
jgi:hypothetical protein